MRVQSKLPETNQSLLVFFLPKKTRLWTSPYQNLVLYPPTTRIIKLQQRQNQSFPISACFHEPLLRQHTMIFPTANSLTFRMLVFLNFGCLASDCLLPCAGLTQVLRQCSVIGLSVWFLKSLKHDSQKINVLIQFRNWNRK